MSDDALKALSSAELMKLFENHINDAQAAAHTTGYEAPEREGSYASVKAECERRLRAGKAPVKHLGTYELMVGDQCQLAYGTISKLPERGPFKFAGLAHLLVSKMREGNSGV